MADVEERQNVQVLNARTPLLWSVENISNDQNFDITLCENSGTVTESKDIQENDADPAESNQTAVEFDKEVFIEEVRKYRCLWDINLEACKNRPIKQNVWNKIGLVFSRDGEFMCECTFLH